MLLVQPPWQPCAAGSCQVAADAPASVQRSPTKHYLLQQSTG